MLETQDEKSGQTAFSNPDQQRDVRLQESFHSAVATTFEWDIESDTFVRDYSSEPALPASRELPRSLSQLRNAVYPDDLEAFDSAIQTVLANGSHYRNLFRVIRPDHSIVWLEEWGRLERRIDGNPHKLTGFSVEVTHHMQAVAELQQKNRCLQAMTEVVNDALFVKDRLGRYVCINSAAARLVHKNPADIYGKDNHAFFSTNDTEKLREFDERVMKTQSPEIMTTTATLDNEIRHFEILKKPFLDEQGNVSGVAGRCQDITDELRFDDQLTQIWENSVELICMGGDNGYFSKVNPAFTNCLGWSSEELTSRPWLDFVHPEDVEATIAANQQFLQVEKIIGIENRFRCKDGSYRWLSWHTVPRKLDGGGYAFARDVTERKQAELALRHERVFLRQVMDSLLGFVGVLTVDGVIQELNETPMKLMKLSREQIIGKKFCDVGWIHESSLKSVLQAINAAATGQSSRFECMTIFPEIGIRSIDAIFSPLRNSAGQITNVIAYGNDITELKRLESQLLQSQKIEALGRLAGGVAHDFNNFLTVINGYGGITLSELPADSPLKEYLTAIVEAGKGASDLTRQLLAFSRNAVVSMSNVDLNQTIEETVKLIRRLIQADISLEFSCEPGLPEIQGAKVQIEQIIINLVLNARDSIKSQGEIRIESQRVSVTRELLLQFPSLKPGDYAQLAISDNGCGMNEATKQKIFEPFFTTKELGRGTGLGLSIVHGIVNQFGGAISVESQQDVGTTFKILLPFARQPEQSSGTVDRDRNVRGNETVLLVEDETNVRKIVRINLEKKGYRVLDASKASEALLLAEEHSKSINLLLTDVVMPEMSGPELVVTFRQLYPNVPVIFMSGYNEDELLRYGIARSEEILFQKPLHFELLIAKIRELLDQNASASVTT